MKPIRILSILLSLGLCAFGAEPKPLVRAHAHNDYAHPRPLLDALDKGFCSIEADIYLVDGKLLVGHDRKALKPERTLKSLYLDPLRERVKQNSGSVYLEGPAVTLLVDVKSEARSTYAALHELLKGYAPMLTVFRNGIAVPGAVTVIISGERALADLAEQPVRYAAMDGRIDDLTGTAPGNLLPWISDNWQKVFAWRWAGVMPLEEREKLSRLVLQAHAQGRRVRFWNTPDTLEAWGILFDADVDLINTDKLAELQAFLSAQPANSRH